MVFLLGSHQPKCWYCIVFMIFSFSSAFIRVINSLVFNRLLDNLNKFCLLYFQVHAHKWLNVLCGNTEKLNEAKRNFHYK